MKQVGAVLLGLMSLVSLSSHAASRQDDAKALLSSAKFAKARAALERDYDRTIDDLVALTEIPAPPFKEQARAAAYLALLKAHGLRDVELDAEGNAMGLRPGTGGGPLIVVAAHLDTVFPEGTPIKVRREGNKLLAPGIGDDTSGLAALLAYLRAMDAAGYRHKADILFVGNVGEEGPGDLRGVRHLFTQGKYKDRIAAFISYEPGRAGRITNGGVGSLRYQVGFTGPGGHSYGSFGLVNPAYAMGQAITGMGRIQVPKTPKTTYNVGVLEGGTSVNSIPHTVAMTVDMRSAGKHELEQLRSAFLALLQPAVDAENAARDTREGKVAFEAKLIGDRPVGQTAEDTDLVQIARAVARAGGKEARLGASSTDANLPMSLGIPAITLGSGFASTRSHSLDESVELDKPVDVEHLSLALASLLLLAGAQ
jgi:acetylornithine deacetylase/succinyl-diaminopimelate desuccinylase-like protein